MAEVQERLDKFETRFSTLEQQFAAIMSKVDMAIVEMQQQREDIRQERMKHDLDVKELNARIDAKFDKLSEQIHTMTIAAVVGFGAIAAAIGGLIISALK